MIWKLHGVINREHGEYSTTREGSKEEVVKYIRQLMRDEMATSFVWVVTKREGEMK